MSEGPILVVDDEASIVTYVRLGLELEGFEVVTATTGNEAMEALASLTPSLVVLDVMLPDIDGLTICKRVRERGSDIPILMLTALSESEDVVRGLDSGADAYLPKPFKLQELLARVQALLRLVGQGPSDVLTWNDLSLDRAARQLILHGQRIDLARREFAVLEMLMGRPQKVHSRQQLMDEIWGPGEHDYKTLKTCVSDLRAKMGDEGRRLIRSVRGVGYTLGG